MTRPTMLLLQSLTSSGIRMFALLLTMTTAALAGVTVYFPVSGSTVTSPVHIRAAATSTYPITYTRIYVDNVSVWGSAVSRFNTYLNMKAGNRSEEHTSELQSLAYLVCRLLLEKKK